MLRRVPFGGKAGICGKTDCDRRDAASGRISIQGSKNAVLPILAACLLGEGPCELENCPEIKDVEDTYISCASWAAR